MEEYILRSGIDRRMHDIFVSDDQRQLEDRRAKTLGVKTTIELVKKIPLFKGLSDVQYLQLHSICSSKTIPKNSFIYYEGEDSNDLYILLKGRLRITVKGTLLNVLYPLSMVGEIGVFIDGKRSASVLVDEEAEVIRIPKNDLLTLMKNDIILSNQIRQNVIYDLVGKLQEDNRIIKELREDKNTLPL
jgi:CRP/FNR family transcriptional regulator, cyclic AMP receptor protein